MPADWLGKSKYINPCFKSMRVVPQMAPKRWETRNGAREVKRTCRFASLLARIRVLELVSKGTKTRTVADSHTSVQCWGVAAIWGYGALMRTQCTKNIWNWGWGDIGLVLVCTTSGSALFHLLKEPLGCMGIGLLLHHYDKKVISNNVAGFSWETIVNLGFLYD